MLHAVEVSSYRALRYIHAELSDFQVFIGPNASGKSTFFDVINLVRDLLLVGPERAVFGDARFQIPRRAADPRELTWARRGGPLEIALTFKLPEERYKQSTGQRPYARYEVALQTDGEIDFSNETLWLCKDLKTRQPRIADLFSSFPGSPSPSTGEVVFPSHTAAPGGWKKIVNKVVESGNDSFRSETTGWKSSFRLGPGKSALANLPEDQERFPGATWVKRFLMEGVHRVALNAEAMRLPSPVGSPRSFQPDGSNLPWVVHALEQRDPDRLGLWVDHLRTALPDLREVRTREREADRARYLEVTYANNLTLPSWLLSDGTLRMLALTLLAYADLESSLLLIEEPENGIHPRAIECVMQSLSSIYDAQVFCATHSTLVLSVSDPGQLLCFAKNEEGAVDIIRGEHHPRLQRWRAGTQLGDLFATGVLG